VTSRDLHNPGLSSLLFARSQTNINPPLSTDSEFHNWLAKNIQCFLYREINQNSHNFCSCFLSKLIFASAMPTYSRGQGPRLKNWSFFITACIYQTYCTKLKKNKKLKTDWSENGTANNKSYAFLKWMLERPIGIQHFERNMARSQRRNIVTDKNQPKTLVFPCRDCASKPLRWLFF
jgi:hypothetical protein